MEAGDNAGQRIDNYLVGMLKGVPKNRVYRMIRKGEVRVNGGRIKPTYRLRPTDQIRIPPHFAPERADERFPDRRQLAALERGILFEDEGLLVLDKPAGLAVHGGSGVALGAIEALRRLRPDCKLELAHRLDRDTSGCLLIAKRRSVLRRLHEQLRDGLIIKEYRLIARGLWPADLTEVAAPLEKFIAVNGERRVRVSAAGKPSRTSFEVIAHAPDATLLTAVLHTGRTHQIRVHAAHAGHSILGDEKYAAADDLRRDRELGVRRLCLHAARLIIPQQSGEQVFESPDPPALTAAWQACERVGETRP